MKDRPTLYRLLVLAALPLFVVAAISPVINRLRDLRDVRLPSSITSGHVLSWNGTQWTNAISYGTATNLASGLSATNLQLVTPKDFTATNITVATEVYDATGWDNDNTVPTKDAVRDKIEASAGDMTKAVYDADADSIVDVAEGLTDSATVTNLSAKSVTVNSASDGIFMALRPTSGASNDAFQIQGAGNAKLGGWGADGSLSSPSATISNQLTAGGLIVVSNANIGGTLTATNAALITPTIASLANATHTHLDAAGGGTLTAPAIPTTLRDTTFTNVTATTLNVATTANLPSGTIITNLHGPGSATFADAYVTNSLDVGGLTVRSNISAAGTGYFNDLVATNSMSIAGTNGSITLDDGADDSTFVVEAGADMASNIRWNWSNTDTSGALYYLNGTNVAQITGTQGDILYYNGTTWTVLAAGTSNYVLATKGAAQNPAWVAASAGSSPTTTEGDMIYFTGAADARLAVGGRGSHLMANGTDPYWADMNNTWVFEEECYGAAFGVGVMTWSTSAAGGGAGAAGGDATSFGYWRYTINTNASSAATYLNTSGWCFTNAVYYISARVKIGTLNDGNEDQAFRVGFGDSATADFADGLYFEYSTNANWLVKAAENATRTVTVSTNAVSTDWVTLKLWTDTTYTNVYYDIAGTGTQTFSSDYIPTEIARASGPSVNHIKTASAASTTMYSYIDFFKVFAVPTYSR